MPFIYDEAQQIAEILSNYFTGELDLCLLDKRKQVFIEYQEMTKRGYLLPK